jgi:hypothetical protein
LLLVSEKQGVGKTTLFEKILTPFVGFHNSSFPTSSMVVEGRFNSFMVRKRLVVVNEIYEGHSFAAYNKMKTRITDATVEAEEKNKPTYTLDNWAHWGFCSNNALALKVDDNDRRILAVQAVEVLRSESYWKKFNAFLVEEDGVAAFGGFFQEFLVGNEGVAAGAHAPMTALKEEMIAASRSSGKQLAEDVARKLLGRRGADGELIPTLVLMCDLRDKLEANERKVFDTEIGMLRFMMEFGITTRLDSKGKPDRLELIVNSVRCPPPMSRQHA